MTPVATLPPAATASRFTPEQRAAIADRDGSSLLAAGAGSGKTAVMVERFVEAVRLDGVAVGAVLALTFTEKAAAELRERIRRRFAELGEDEHARAVDAAWIGTIHGFCARVLRAHPLAAGLDPRFSVLDEAAARRIAAAAFETALEEWTAAHGEAAVDVGAVYSRDLETMITSAHTTLRSRGTGRPRLEPPPPRPAPDPAALRAAAAAAGEAIRAVPGNGSRVATALEALELVERLTATPAATPLPRALDGAKLPTGAKALDQAPCAAYRDAWSAFQAACADHHARPVLVLLDDLLDRFGTTYAAAKAARAGVDFEDLQLHVRDLLAGDAAARARWAERFALIMVDEFQDTNRLQLDVLEALERDNLFAVGDEAQSIYGFRHADVGIFRARRAALPVEQVRHLTVNFRSRPEILDVVNSAFAPLLGAGFEPLVAGRGPDELRLFAPDPPLEPRVELLVCAIAGWEEREAELGLATLAAQTWRRAEARAVAARLREEVDAGRPAGDVVVLVRATSSLRLFEQALEEQGLPTYVVGGRGYWSQAQVRDAVAYLSVLANPLDEAALYGVLSSPFCGVGTDALLLLAEAGRTEGGGAWAALRSPGAWLDALSADDRRRLTAFAGFAAGERLRAERLPVEVLLERAIAATGYDLEILGGPGGERRLANLRKLMRLAREYEGSEGRDLRGFLTYAAGQDLAEAREGEAALESEGLDAVRLMTIHRAKGLEFPVVCVADLGRPGVLARERLLVGPGANAGLRLATLAGGDPVPALGYDAITERLTAAEAAEERRLLYVAATRAEERLILSGGIDIGRWPPPRPGGPVLDWLAPALLGDPAAALVAGEETVAACGDGAVAARLVTPATLPPDAAAPDPRDRAAAPGTALPAAPKLAPVVTRPRVAQRRLSYSALRDYARCPYRFYLERVLGLPRVAAPPAEPEPAPAPVVEPLEARARGTLVHVLLERLDFARPSAPDAATVHALAAELGVPLHDEHVPDVQRLVAAFAGSPLCARLAAARHVRREAGFAYALDADGGGPLVRGFVDVLAAEPDGTLLVVDYKTDALGEVEPATLVERDYAIQRGAYALAGLQQHGAERVEVAYCLLERPQEPVAAVFTRADIPALEAAVHSLAAGLLAERWPVAAAPHRDLCGDCPGRRALCSWPEALTLRPGHEASAGALAGNGGPS